MLCWGSSVMLQRQRDLLHFDTIANAYQTIPIDETHAAQTIEGFGLSMVSTRLDER